MRRIIPLFIMFLAIACIPTFSSAQSKNSDLSLSTTPSFPEADSEFTVTLTSFDQNRASIRWFLDGTEKTEFKNKNSAVLTAKGIGAASTILAKVTLLNGAVLQVSKTIIPNRVDIAISADTAVPPFYEGRSLPTSGSLVTATALTFTKANKSPKEYVYVWKINGKTQNGGGVLGENSISFTPAFENNVFVTVDVFDRSGAQVASKSISVPVVKPEIAFYEKNPLRGLSFTALNDPYILVGDEATIRAEGYYMNKDMLNGNVLKEWSINGKPAHEKNGEPEEVTFRRQGNPSKSQISFHIRNLSQLLQGAKSTLHIQF